MSQARLERALLAAIKRAKQQIKDAKTDAEIKRWSLRLDLLTDALYPPSSGLWK